MSVVVPINEYQEQSQRNCEVLAEYIFEISEKLPNDFYLDIMSLLKIYHEYGTNLNRIHVFLYQSENKIEMVILNKIREHLNILPSEVIAGTSVPANYERKESCFKRKCHDIIDRFKTIICFFTMLLVISSFVGGFGFMIINNYKNKS